MRKPIEISMQPVEPEQQAYKRDRSVEDEQQPQEPGPLERVYLANKYGNPTAMLKRGPLIEDQNGNQHYDVRHQELTDKQIREMKKDGEVLLADQHMRPDGSIAIRSVQYGSKHNGVHDESTVRFNTERRSASTKQVAQNKEPVGLYSKQGKPKGVVGVTTTRYDQRTGEVTYEVGSRVDKD